MGKLVRALESFIYLLVIPDKNPSYYKLSLWYPIKKSLNEKAKLVNLYYGLWDLSQNLICLMLGLVPDLDLDLSF